MSMEIALTNGFFLSSVRAGDVDDYVRVLGDGEIATTIPAFSRTQNLQQGGLNIESRFLKSTV
jgi:hypothetical protein